MDFSKLVFIDTETTGTDPTRDRIIEIALIFVDNGEIVDRFHTTINPQLPISPFIKEITGISQEELASSPVFDEIALALRNSLKGHTLVAHNARFDYSFLKHEFKRLNLDFSSPHLCTVKLSRRLFPHFQHHNLDSIISRFQISCDQRHRAMADAQAIVDFYFILRKDLSNHTLTEALKKSVRRLSSPPNLASLTELETLPEAPGVYILYGPNNSILYIGKSINIKSRIFSHFHGSLSSGKEMDLLNRITHIECIPTAGDLSACLLESTLIKQKSPLYNRQLRKADKQYFLEQTTLPGGYYSLNISEVSSPKSTQVSSFLGPFRNYSQAQKFLRFLADDHSLCPKLLGLDKGSPSCFNYHLEKCHGACIGEEHFLKYNLRFLQAVSPLKLPPWPFTQTIAITETDSNHSLTQHILINNWQVTKTVTIQGDDLPQIELFHQDEFDFDTYKIIKRFLKKPSTRKKISTSPQF